MYGKLKGKKIKRRASFWQTVLLALIVVFSCLLAGSLRGRGIAQNWTTAILATLITFGFVIYAFRERLLRWSFWVSLSACLAAHIAAVWVLLHYVLYNFGRFSILLWYPIMLVEVFVLLIAVKRIEEKLTGKHETIKLSI